MSKTVRKFYVFNAGCIRRGLDVMLVRKYLEVNGWRMTNTPRKAALIVVATCGVVGKNEENSLQALSVAAKRGRSGATIVVMGCLPKINPDAIQKLGEFKFVPSGELSLLDRVIDAQVPIAAIPSPDSVVHGAPVTDYLVARSFCRRSRLYRWLFGLLGMNVLFLKVSVAAARMRLFMRNAFMRKKEVGIAPYYNIKIADGCMSDCSYCATKLATGTLRSRPPDVLLSEFKEGVSRGYGYIQLVSEDTGCYGLDIGTSLTDLLAQFMAVEGDYKLIVIDYNPCWLIAQQNDLLPLLGEYQFRFKELFLPVQSGSDRILRNMERTYTCAEVMAVLQRLNRVAPSIALRTTLLIGFPGETEEDFAATRRLISEVRFSEVTVNRYEDRPNTPASRMDDKVPQETIEARAHVLAEKHGCRILS
jgi:tRNA A37 methylthiotransferase MiaB